MSTRKKLGTAGNVPWPQLSEMSQCASEGKTSHWKGPEVKKLLDLSFRKNIAIEEAQGGKRKGAGGEKLAHEPSQGIEIFIRRTPLRA